MKKFILIITILSLSLICKSQYIDCFVLSSGFVIHTNNANNTNNTNLDDKILHYWCGYYGTKAIEEILEKKFNKRTSICLSVVSILAIATIKELTDKKFVRNDILATEIGSGLSIISLKINF